MFWVVEENEHILAQSLQRPRRTASLQPSRDLPLVKFGLFRLELVKLFPVSSAANLNEVRRRW
jgi:hypothetical protein